MAAGQLADGNGANGVPRMYTTTHCRETLAAWSSQFAFISPKCQRATGIHSKNGRFPRWRVGLVFDFPKGHVLSTDACRSWAMENAYPLPHWRQPPVAPETLPPA